MQGRRRRCSAAAAARATSSASSPSSLPSPPHRPRRPPRPRPLAGAAPPAASRARSAASGSLARTTRSAATSAPARRDARWAERETDSRSNTKPCVVCAVRPGSPHGDTERSRSSQGDILMTTGEAMCVALEPLPTSPAPTVNWASRNAGRPPGAAAPGGARAARPCCGAPAWSPSHRSK